MATNLAAPPPMEAPAPDAPAAPKPGTKRKDTEPEPDRQDEAMRDYLLADSISSAAAKLLQIVPVDANADEDEDEDRELAEWMAATADEQWALIHELEAKLGITSPPDLLEPYVSDDDPDGFGDPDFSVLRPEGYKEKESKRRLGWDGLVRYYD